MTVYRRKGNENFEKVNVSKKFILHPERVYFIAIHSPSISSKNNCSAIVPKMETIEDENIIACPGLVDAMVTDLGRNSLEILH